MKRQIDKTLVRTADDGRIHATIDGQPVTADPGDTIWEVANRVGIEIPALCHQSEEMLNTHVDLSPVGVCRLCCVSVGEGGRPARDTMSASCMRPIEDGMDVQTTNPQIDEARRTLLELLLSDHPTPCEAEETSDCELEEWAGKLAVGEPTFPERSLKVLPQEFALKFPDKVDLSNPSIRVDHNACILCDRCIRACGDVRNHHVIGRAGKGYATSIAFDNNLAMQESSCVNCGECMISCPTGAITYSGSYAGGDEAPELKPGVGGGKIEGGIQPTIAMLRETDVFKGVASEFLKKSLGGIRVKHFKKGDIICRQGEYGHTAFYITEGSAAVHLELPEPPKKRGVFDLLNRFRRDDGRHKGGMGADGYIPLDAPVDVAYGKPVNTIAAGSLFGEMTCMSFYPRSATVIAAEDVECLEMLRNVLDIIRKNKDFRDRIDANYKASALASHLRGVGLFKDLKPDPIPALEEAAEFVQFEPGDVICREGDLADAFYIVRIGHVKVSRPQAAGDDRVLAYLPRGQCFGEIATLGAMGAFEPDGSKSDVEALAAAGRRTATCTALDHVDAVRFPRERLEAVLHDVPMLRERLLEVAGKRLAETKEIQLAPSVPTGGAGIQEFVDNGLYQAQSLLVLDLENCTRCDECVRACADAHGGITRMVRDGIRFDQHLIATSCRQCHDPLCMVGCPVGSIHRKENGSIVIEDWCIGCGLCAQNCPYGSIIMHEYDAVEEQTVDGLIRKAAVVRERAAACDLSPEMHEPACVYACPHDAARRVSAREFFEETLAK